MSDRDLLLAVAHALCLHVVESVDTKTYPLYTRVVDLLREAERAPPPDPLAQVAAVATAVEALAAELRWLPSVSTRGLTDAVRAMREAVPGAVGPADGSGVAKAQSEKKNSLGVQAGTTLGCATPIMVEARTPDPRCPSCAKVYENPLSWSQELGTYTARCDACGVVGVAWGAANAAPTVTFDPTPPLTPLPVEPDPVPMLLYCPACGSKHVDRPTPSWDNPPHRSHLCAACGVVWRPADVPTVGVAELRTGGRGDTFDASRAYRLTSLAETLTDERDAARAEVTRLLETLRELALETVSSSNGLTAFHDLANALRHRAALELKMSGERYRPVEEPRP